MANWTLVGNPGSYKAVYNGCICSMMDNCRGEGRGGDGAKFGWYVNGSCPLHGLPDKETEVEKPEDYG